MTTEYHILNLTCSKYVKRTNRGEDLLVFDDTIEGYPSLEHLVSKVWNSVYWSSLDFWFFEQCNVHIPCNINDFELIPISKLKED